MGDQDATWGYYSVLVLLESVVVLVGFAGLLTKKGVSITKILSVYLSIALSVWLLPALILLLTPAGRKDGQMWIVCWGLGITLFACLIIFWLWDTSIWA